MFLLLLAAVLFVLWLNIFAAPKRLAAVPVTTPVERTQSNEPNKDATVAQITSAAAVTPPTAAAIAAETPEATTNAALPKASQPMGQAMAPLPITPITPGGLLIPVAGVQAEQLRDSFGDGRSEGRMHNAIDIAAAQGTPVLATADGSVCRLLNSAKGGITLYQLSADQQTVFYYAHLDRYADSVAEGKAVRQGEVLGYVGDTGNAGAGNYHLHFAVWRIADAKKFWHGENLNPYSLLRR